jgi:hypothetical protein
MEISPTTLHDLTLLQEEITKENSSDENNLVLTFGTTFVLGGLYQNSYHPNSTFSNNPKLLHDVYEIVSKAINEAFKKHKWYRDLKKLIKTHNDYEERIKDALILDLPCTTIRWSIITEAQKEHTYPHAHGPTFLFCLGKGKPGIVHILVPGTTIDLTNSMDEGKILAGRFARSLHWYDPVEGMKHLVEVYFDDRIFDKKYNKIIPG